MIRRHLEIRVSEGDADGKFSPIIIYSDNYTSWESPRGAWYELVDNSLDMSEPNQDDPDEPRTVTFDIHIVAEDGPSGSGVDKVSQELAYLSGIISATNNKAYTDNAGFHAMQYGQQTYTWKVPGVGGVRLITGLYDTSYTTGSGGIDSTFRTVWMVVGGTVRAPTNFFTAENFHIEGARVTLRNVQVELKVMPLGIIEQSQEAVQISGSYYGPWRPEGNGWYAFKVEPNYEDAPLQEIGCVGQYFMDANNNTWIVSRFAGTPLWLSPSVPKIVSGGTKIPFFCGVDHGHDNIYTESPAKDDIDIHTYVSGSTSYFQWKFGYETSYRTGVAITPYKKYYVGNTGSKQYVVFTMTTGYEDAYFNMRLHQFNVPGPNTPYTVDNTDPAYMTTGKGIGAVMFNVPPSCRGKYALICRWQPSVYGNDMEMRALISYGMVSVGYSDTAQNDQGVITVQNTYTPWIQVDGNANMAALALLDMTAAGAPFMAHPNAHCIVSASIYVRFKDPNVTGISFTLKEAILTSAQDENATFFAATTAMARGRLVSNSLQGGHNGFYFASASEVDTGANSIYSPPLPAAQLLEGPEAVVTAPASMAAIGAPITLYSGVENHIMAYPMLNLYDIYPTWGVWYAIDHTSSNGNYHVTIKYPRVTLYPLRPK